MNNLRTPVIILVLILVALVAWYLFARESPAPLPAPVSSAVATTTALGQSSQQPAQTTPPTTLDPSTVAADIVGAWQSTDDPNYSITVTASGKWTDSYKGEGASSSTSETGTYTLFTSANPDKDFTGILVPGVIYLKVSEGTSVLYFSVLEASSNTLQLSYLDRGNTLSFVKEQ